MKTEQSLDEKPNKVGCKNRTKVDIVDVSTLKKISIGGGREENFF